MVDFLHTLERGRPAVVGGQICCHQFKAGVVRTIAANGRNYTCLTIQRAHCRAHLTPIAQQRRDQPRAQISGPACHQYLGAHLSTSSSRGSTFCTCKFALASALRIRTVAGIPERRFRP